MYYTVYKITNLINGKIYIGCHKTNNLNDQYMGSGKLLKRSIKKCGIENFKKDILFVYDNPNEMFSTESIIVNEDFINRDDTYNLKEGGYGGQKHPKGHHTNTKEHMEMMRNKTKQVEYSEKRKKIVGNTMKKLHREGKINYCTFKGKKHSKESKKKMSDSRKGLYKGNENSQYGTCWIYNLELEKNKKIKKEELENWISDGWINGRVINFQKLKNKKTFKEKNISKFRKIMYHYRDNDISLRELAKLFNVGQNIYVTFKRYFPEEYEIISKNKRGDMV